MLDRHGEVALPDGDELDLAAVGDFIEDHARWPQLVDRDVARQRRITHFVVDRWVEQRLLIASRRDLVALAVKPLRREITCADELHHRPPRTLLHEVQMFHQAETRFAFRRRLRARQRLFCQNLDHTVSLFNTKGDPNKSPLLIRFSVSSISGATFSGVKLLLSFPQHSVLSTQHCGVSRRSAPRSRRCCHPSPPSP